MRTTFLAGEVRLLVAAVLVLVSLFGRAGDSFSGNTNGYDKDEGCQGCLQNGDIIVDLGSAELSRSSVVAATGRNGADRAEENVLISSSRGDWGGHEYPSVAAVEQPGAAVSGASQEEAIQAFLEEARLEALSLRLMILVNDYRALARN